MLIYAGDRFPRGRNPQSDVELTTFKGPYLRPRFQPSRCRQIERKTAPWSPVFSAVLLLFGYLIFEAVTRLFR